MKGLKEQLLQEQKRLQNIITVTKTRLQDAPQGKIRISKSHGYFQYYQCTGKNDRGVYIDKENRGLIPKLIQKNYDEKVLRVAEKQWKQVKRLVE